MIKRIGLMVWASIVALGLAPVWAIAADEPTRAFVVLVGIDDYKDPQIKDRKHAEADAKALYDLFVSKDHLGVKADDIKLFLGGEDKKRNAQAATHANIVAALQWLDKNAGKDDLVIFGFFGNGAPSGERAVYFTTDSTFKNRGKDALAAGDIEQAIDKLKSQRFIALLDVNFLGFDAGKETAPDPNLANFYREFLGNEEAKSQPSRVVFLANSGLKPSLNLKDHGIFAEAVIQGLKGNADKEGYEPDGNITVGELAKFVRSTVPKLAREFGKSDEDKAQLPVIIEGQSSDFIVDFNPAAHPLALKRIEAFEKIAKDKAFDKAILEEGVDLLTLMPKLEAQQALRKIYQKLADEKLDVADFQRERQDILASTRLAERDAGNYAITVLKAAEVVRQEFFKETNTGAMVNTAVEGLFKQVNEKIPSAIKDKLALTKTMKKADLLKLLQEARTHLGKREDLGEGKDVTISLHSMLNKLDKHTGYIDPSTVKRLETEIQGHFFGIGVQIRKNFAKDMLQVVTPIRGSPAYKAKMFAGDTITTIIREVDDKGNKLPEPKVLNTKGMSTEEAVKNIIGPEGTPIKLIVEREGEAKPMEFNLLRGKVEVESLMGYKRNDDDSWSYVVDPENKICYVRLTQFTRSSYRDLEQVMRKLYKAGIKGFILDLRFNPGGLLDQAVKISDLFIDDGLVVTIRPRSGPETSYVGKSDGSYTTFPMVCLINGGSASASEIVSACLQDHGRAIILGTRSYGKGSVQNIQPFETGGLLKLTTATFWRPSNRNLNRSITSKDEDDWGVIPNKGYLVKMSKKEENDLQDFQRDQEIIRRPDKRGEASKEFTDSQLEAALQYLRQQIRTANKSGVEGKTKG